MSILFWLIFHNGYNSTFTCPPHLSKDCVTIPICHCERPKGACLHTEVPAFAETLRAGRRFGTQAWQSLYFQGIMRLLRSLHSLAMTLRHSLSRDRVYGQNKKILTNKGWFGLYQQVITCPTSLPTAGRRVTCPNFEIQF